MDIENYLEKIRDFALSSYQDIEPTKLLKNLYNINDPELIKAVTWRVNQATESDKKTAEDYLKIELFTEQPTDSRIGLILIALDVEKQLKVLSWERFFEKYNSSQPIFIKNPELMEEIRQRKDGGADLELLSDTKLQQHNETSLFKYKNHFLVAPHYLPPSVPAWTRTQFPTSRVFIRINPFVIRTESPRYHIAQFETLIPPNPTWWKNTLIYRGQNDGSSFFLEQCACTPETGKKYWEYNMRGIRKLEFTANRRNNGNLSIMLEELAVQPKEEFLIGRVIHLDSDSMPGTPPEKALLNHLDLAINVYKKNNAELRLNQDLAKGMKVTDACQRIHLFRVENIPLSALLVYVEQFFISKTLKAEWMAAQTQPSTPQN